MLCDRLDLLFDGQIHIVDRNEVARLFARFNYLFRQLDTAVAALAEHLGKREVSALLSAIALDKSELSVSVGAEAVDRYDNGDTVFTHVLDMYAKVFDTLFKRLEVSDGDLGLRHAAVVFERAAGSYYHDGRGLQAGVAALYVKEFLCAEIGAETRLGDGVIGKLERELCGANAVAAVGDISEGAAVHNGGSALESLNKIGLDSVLEQRGHSAVSLDVLSINGLARVVVSDKYVAQPALKVVDIRRKAKDSHDLGGNGDDEVILARNSVDLSAESYDDIAQSAVVHVEAALEKYPARVDAELVALLDVVVEHGAAKVIG